MMEESKPDVEKKEKPEKSFWRPIMIEFVTVFFGVMGAFLVNDWQADKQELRNKVTYFEAFIGDIKHLQYQVGQLESVISDIQKNANGNVDFKVTPNPNLRLKTNDYLIQSAFQNENFTAIGTQYLNNLSFGSNVISEIKDRVDNVRERSREYYLSVRKDEEEVKRFKEWYLNELSDIKILLNQLNEIIEQGALPGTQSILERIKE